MLNLGRGLAAEHEGALIGTVLYWTFGRDTGALGLVCVAHEHQGRGIGRRLLDKALGELGPRRLVLHATGEGLRLYETRGFAAAGAIRQHQGAAFRPILTPLRPGERVRPTGRSDPDVLAALDRQATGMDRRPLVGALLEAGTGVVLDHDGTATGFAILRRFGAGQVVGPVVAPDQAGARALVGHFLAANPGQFIRIDVPELTGLSPWLQGLGLADAGSVIRMVRGTGLDRPRNFALVSQAFG